MFADRSRKIIAFGKNVHLNQHGRLFRKYSPVASTNSQCVKIEYPSTKKEKNKSKINNYVLMLCYCGKGYTGLQRNRMLKKTIEEEVLRAMYQAQVITEKNYETPQSMDFQRASRTDKGVSALRQILNMTLCQDVAEDINSVSKINQFLPEQIRIFDIKKVTKNFCAKNYADGRTYTYLCPTYAFAPIDSIVSVDYRITESIMDEIKKKLIYFTGVHNYFNYTIGEKHYSKRTYRTIWDFDVSEPFFRDGCEYILFTVKGASFMLHQIRMMIGTIIGIMRSSITEDIFMKSWMGCPVELPIAPANGLLLEEIHYTNYNKKEAGDGFREPLLWTEHQAKIMDFKEKYIYSEIVKEDRLNSSMLRWLPILLNRTWSLKETSPTTNNDQKNYLSPVGKLVYYTLNKRKENEEIDPAAEEERLLRLIVKTDD